MDPAFKSYDKFELNLHPPINKLMDASMDILNLYKWSFLTVLYQEPYRIEDIVRLTGSEYQENKLRFQFRLLSADTNEWAAVIREIKSSGSFHIIIDIDTKSINSFLNIV